MLVGAQTGQVQATMQRKLSAKWQGSVSLGYASNGSLVPPSASFGKDRLQLLVCRGSSRSSISTGNCTFL